MKLNKKIVAINLLATVLISESVSARIQGVRTPGTSGGTSTSDGGGGRGTPARHSTATKEEAQKVIAVSEASCSGDQEAAKYFPQELFSHVTRDGSGLGIELRPNNKVMVKIPPILNVCGNFVPELRQNKDTKNVAILMKLVGVKKEKVVVDGVESIKEIPNSELTYKEFEDCLKQENILVDGKINHDGIPGKKYSENVYSMDYDFDKKLDVKKSVSVSFAYPKEYSDPNTGYGPLYGFDEKITVAGEACMRAEKIAEETVYINKGQDVLIEQINNICQNGTAQEIAAARKSIGNAEPLKDIADKIKAEMDARYLIAVKTDVARIDGEMKKIEDKLNKNKDTMDEATAKKELAKYAELAKELDSTFMNPAIYRIDTLMQKRTSLEDDSQEMKDVDAEIKKLNEDVSQFAKRNPTSFASVYSVMEKFAITDAAKTVEDIRLKSYLYSKVYAGPVDEKRGKPLTFETANQQQFEKLQKFDKTLSDWTDQYLVGQGNLYPIKKTEKERQLSIDRMNSRWAAYEKKEYQDYNNYCAVGMLGSVKNPVKCKDFMAGMEQRRNRELKKREKDLYFIKGRNEKLEKMGMNYNEYQRKVASREQADSEMYEPYGSSYTSYEDNFSDRYPGYYGPSTTTAYDPAMYNMGGMSGSMMMGQQQQQMYYPQQQSQMMMGGQQGYQYQMPQMGQMGGQMMGAWPGL